MSFRPPYRYITAPSLASLLHRSTSLPRRDIAIVDVRDDDFEGGNIVGCINVPSTTFADKVSELVRELKEVVFHCSLSQARGPKSARIYAEVRESLLEQGKVSPVTSPESGDNDEEKLGGQSILVLREGFSNFGRVYKNDPKLVEKYDEEAWSYR